MDIEAKNIVEIVEPSLKARVTALIYGFIPHLSLRLFCFLSLSLSLTGLVLHLSKLLFCTAYFKYYKKIYLGFLIH